MALPDRLPPDLEELAREVRDPKAGFFGPGSYLWRLLRENTIQLAGPYAALMQVAHPHVAQGVAEHSAYDTDPIGRLRRTFTAVHRIVFGSLDAALEAALQTRNIHKRVQGTLPTPTQAFEEGSRYHANRADLLLWVQATLIEGAMLGHERFVRPLSQDEREGLYRELTICGRLFGVPKKSFPADYAAFRIWYERQIEETLEVTPAGKDIADNIIWNAGYYKVAAPLIILSASGMLPPRIRRQYGLPWNRLMEGAFEAFSLGVRQGRIAVPRFVLYRSAYLNGLRRMHEPLPPLSGVAPIRMPLPGEQYLQRLVP